MNVFKVPITTIYAYGCGVCMKLHRHEWQAEECCREEEE